MKASTLIACLLIVSSCSRGPETTQLDGKRNTSSPSAADQVAADARSASYAEAQSCFLDVAMRTMEPIGSSGEFSANPQMLEIFKSHAISAGGAVGKTEDQVMGDLRNAVAAGAASVDRMTQSQKEKYVLDTNAHAISCLKSKRAKLTQQGSSAFPKSLAQETGEATRRARCALTEAESQKVFEDFVRLEDQEGKDNAAHEVSVGRSNQITAECVRQTMIAGLEVGRVPPGLQ